MKLKDKIAEADNKAVDYKVTRVIYLLDEHQSSEKEEYELKQKNVANLVLRRWCAEQNIFVACGKATSTKMKGHTHIQMGKNLFCCVSANELRLEKKELA
ncbi:Heat shock 70 kDa protein [Phytophthora palmivora]|uniref:Heat shock 70 kDa protein n=1 Tax=Phytophthora palmivora TaxID=4796 RepID=A0A2P4YF93_9STRA|nr:Heat shock 70 kDa protein [Phytophthora palmivora]